MARTCEQLNLKEHCRNQVALHTLRSTFAGAESVTVAGPNKPTAAELPADPGCPTETGQACQARRGGAPASQRSLASQKPPGAGLRNAGQWPSAGEKAAGAASRLALRSGLKTKPPGAGRHFTGR